MQFSDIDNGKTFDWGNTSKDYAPEVFDVKHYVSIAELQVKK